MSFRTTDRGAAGVEYAILAAAIAALIALIAYQLGGKVVSGFNIVVNAMP